MGVPRASGYGLNHIDGRLDHQSIHGIWGSILGPLLGQPLGQLAQPLGLGIRAPMGWPIPWDP